MFASEVCKDAKRVTVPQRPVVRDQLRGAQPEAISELGKADGGEGHLGRALQQLPDGERGPSHHH